MPFDIRNPARSVRYALADSWHEAVDPAFNRLKRFLCLARGDDTLWQSLAAWWQSGSAAAVGPLADKARNHPDRNFTLSVAELLLAAGRRMEARGLFERLLQANHGPAAAYSGLIATTGPDAHPLLPRRLLFHHLGLGDHLICHGLVRNRAGQGEPLGIFAKHHYAESVGFMFRDHPNIRVLAVADNREARSFLRRHVYLPVETIGFEFLSQNQGDFATDFYRQANIDYSHRWGDFHVMRDRAREEALFRRLVPDAAPYVFVHDDPSRGLRIDRALIRRDLPIVFPTRGITDNIFDYCTLLEQAQEIHCMDSSFRHLTDCLTAVAGRLFLHYYVKKSNVPSRHNWILIRDPGSAADAT
jgi:hypothetical protein